MRGKSHTARELKRYIEFFHGSRAEIFHVSEHLALEEVSSDESCIDAVRYSGTKGCCVCVCVQQTMQGKLHKRCVCVYIYIYLYHHHHHIHIDYLWF